MSLKIRRGTNAERLTITPAEGELIYTTDTKNLYVGDGATVGGKIVSGYVGSVSNGYWGSVGYTGSIGTGYTGSGATGYTGSASTVVGYTGSAGGGYSGSGGSGYDGSVGYRGSVGYNGSVGYRGSVGYTGSTPTGGSLTSNLDISIYTISNDDTLSINGLTNTITSGFIETNSIVSVDDTLHRVSVGNATNSSNLRILSNDTTYTPALEIKTVLNGSPGLGQWGPIIRINSNNGDFETPTKLVSGDSLGLILFSGLVNKGIDGVGDSELSGIRSIVDIEGNDTDTPALGKIQLCVLNPGSPDGVIIANFDSVGTFSAPTLQTGSYDGSGNYPNNPVAGMIIFDSNNNHFYGYNGTIWKQLDN